MKLVFHTISFLVNRFPDCYSHFWRLTSHLINNSFWNFVRDNVNLVVYLSRIPFFCFLGKGKNICLSPLCSVLPSHVHFQLWIFTHMSRFFILTIWWSGILTWTQGKEWPLQPFLIMGFHLLTRLLLPLLGSSSAKVRVKWGKSPCPLFICL